MVSCKGFTLRFSYGRQRCELRYVSITYMRRLFEGGIIFIGSLHRVQCLFEGGVYLRVAFHGINTVCVI